MIFTDSLKDVDVLCGRGNGINNMPGNVKFRKLVDEHRRDYTLAPRHSKVNIAKRIVDKVDATGGRFLTFDSNANDWVAVPRKKAIEKACQAMREEVKLVRKKNSPEKTAKKKSPPSKKGGNETSTSTDDLNFKPSPPMKRNRSSTSSPSQKESPKNRQQNYRCTAETTKEGDEKHARPSSSRSGKNKTPAVFTNEDLLNGVASHDMFEIEQLMEESTTPQNNTPAVVSPNTTPVSFRPTPYRLNLTDDTWDKMYEILLRFRATFGHTAVAPNWVGDPDFADWVGRQRQLYREVLETGHRTASSLENDRLMKLQAIDFAWDYCEWHWDKRYKSILKTMKSTFGGADSSSCIIVPLMTPCLRLWLERQRQLLELEQLSEEKVKKLKYLLKDIGWEQAVGEDFILI
jgi:hypothetical protein